MSRREEKMELSLKGVTFRWERREVHIDLRGEGSPFTENGESETQGEESKESNWS